ncbi:GGDEF domain-containing protein [Deinococcus aetherius]|uniref:GGDEF domain-containing protein n=2 Tax=Deinococcus aetherius TaxID=200252 RepID=A0ABN6RGR4_9DEIO|nr:GGDEF domain-containing protein [Deinococcus aetherius]
MLNDLFVNFCVLCTTTFLVGWTLRSLKHAWTWTQIALRALLTVASSFVLIANAVPLAGGVALDLRAVPVALATIGGGVPAGVTVALPLIAYEVWRGGERALVHGLSLALVVGLCALALRGVPRDVENSGVRWWVPFGIFAPSNLPLAYGAYLATGDAGYAASVTLLLTAAQTIGMLASQAITVTQLRALERAEVLTDLAYTDKLTGVGNRRALDEALSHPGDISHVLLLDLDHFKLVNDTRGHDTGDRVLEATAAVMREVLGRRGCPYRFGGEEFAVLLRQTSTAEAVGLAQELRRRVAQEVGTRSGHPDLTLTVSLGLAGVHPASTALERADNLLYAAKRAGRDRVEAEALAVA